MLALRYNSFFSSVISFTLILFFCLLKYIIFFCFIYGFALNYVVYTHSMCSAPHQATTLTYTNTRTKIHSLYWALHDVRVVNVEYTTKLNLIIAIKHYYKSVHILFRKDYYCDDDERESEGKKRKIWFLK